MKKYSMKQRIVTMVNAAIFLDVYKRQGLRTGNAEQRLFNITTNKAPPA